MTQLADKIQEQFSAQYQPWLEKITTLEHCAQSILKATPEMTYLDFHHQVLQLTNVDQIPDSENTLKLLKQQCIQSIKQLFDVSTYQKHQSQLQCLLECIEEPDAILNKSFLSKPRIAIIGAGLAGLFAAYVLAKQGFLVEIFERRSNDEARLRPQNISFKEAETCIKPMLNEQHYAEFFKRGGAMDGDSGKLRITTGSFQDILTEALLERRVNIHYNTPIDNIDLLLKKNFHAILIAAGVHSCERLHLQQHFNPLYFPHYTAHGRTALCIAPSNESHGYQRIAFEGWSWQRNNKTIFSGEAFQHDLQRLINPLHKQSAKDPRITYLKHLIDLPNIEYSFNFGNDTPHFMSETNWPTPPLAPNRETYIVKQWQFSIEPMITEKVISHVDKTLLVAIGDANGSAHPLAALGTIKFCRNAFFLPTLLHSHAILSDLLTTENNALVSACLQSVEQLYHHQAVRNNHEVFWANVCCSLFSRKRYT